MLFSLVCSYVKKLIEECNSSEETTKLLKVGQHCFLPVSTMRVIYLFLTCVYNKGDLLVSYLCLQ